MSRSVVTLFICAFAIAWGVSGGVAGCKRSTTATTQPFPTYSTRPSSGPSTQALTFCVVPSVTPAKVVSRYQPLVNLLSRTLQENGYPKMTLEIARDHSDFDQRLDSGRLSLAVVSGVTIVKRASFGYRIVAKVKNDESFRAALITKQDSPIRTMDDLRGKSISFPAPTIMGGSMMMRMFLHDHGLDRDKDYKATYCETYDSALLMLLDGRSDAASVAMPAWTIMQADKPQLANALKVKWQTQPLIQTAIIVAPGVSDAEADLLRKALVGLDQTSEGQKILAAQHMPGYEAADMNSFLPAKDFLDRYVSLFGPD